MALDSYDIAKYTIIKSESVVIAAEDGNLEEHSIENNNNDNEYKDNN